MSDGGYDDDFENYEEEDFEVGTQTCAALQVQNGIAHTQPAQHLGRNALRTHAAPA